LFPNFLDQRLRVPLDLRVDEQDLDGDGHVDDRQLEVRQLDETAEGRHRVVDAGRSTVKDLLRDESKSVDEKKIRFNSLFKNNVTSKLRFTRKCTFF
jgi:hypothetical protein